MNSDAARGEVSKSSSPTIKQIPTPPTHCCTALLMNWDSHNNNRNPSLQTETLAENSKDFLQGPSRHISPGLDIKTAWFYLIRFLSKSEPCHPLCSEAGKPQEDLWVPLRNVKDLGHIAPAPHPLRPKLTTWVPHSLNLALCMLHEKKSSWRVMGHSQTMIRNDQRHCVVSIAKEQTGTPSSKARIH